MKTTLNERISLAIDSLHMSQNRLAKSLDMEQRSINRQLKGESAISGQLITGIATQFPDISLEWLIRGNGPMYLNEKGNQSSINAENVNNSIINQHGTISGQPIPTADTTIAVLVEAINNLNGIIAKQQAHINELEKA